MNYKEIVKKWETDSENFFNYRFEVANIMGHIYHSIAKSLNIDIKDRLNDQMEVFAIEEKNENKLLHSSYSMPGAVCYEKRGWSSVGLRLLVNKEMSNLLECKEGEYRFIFFIKKFEDNWFFYIDTNYFKDNVEDGVFIFSQKNKEDAQFNSSEENYEEKMFSFIKQKIENKCLWNDSYKQEIADNFFSLIDILKQKLEIKESRLVQVCPKKMDENEENKNYAILDSLQYEIDDWCSVCLCLLFEREINVFPKSNYKYNFYFKKINGSWKYSLNEQFYDANFQKDFNINDSNCIDEMYSTIMKHTEMAFSFERWLKDDTDGRI